MIGYDMTHFFFFFFFWLGRHHFKGGNIRIFIGGVILFHMMTNLYQYQLNRL